MDGEVKCQWMYLTPGTDRQNRCSSGSFNNIIYAPMGSNSTLSIPNPGSILIPGFSTIDNACYFPTSLDENDFKSVRFHNMAIPASFLSSPPQALIFDLMGTCCDWFSSILPELLAAPTLSQLPRNALSQLATDWRAGFFSEIHSRYETRKESEDIDVTHRRVLDRLLEERGVSMDQWDGEVRSRLVESWHKQKGWSAGTKDNNPILRLNDWHYVLQ